MLPGFRTKARIRREAADWAALLGGEPSKQDRIEFERWRNSDPRHADAYDRMMAIWHGGARLSRPVAAPAPARFQPAYAFAAAVALLAFTVSALLFVSYQNRAPTALLATSLSEVREIRLEDGSTLILQPASRAEASVSKSRRHMVLLEGGGRFRIARGDAPFTIEVAGREVVAQQGQFEIMAGEGESLVMPLEGTLEVRPSGWLAVFSRTDRINPGQRLVISEDGERIEEAPALEPSASTEMIELDGVDLAEAAELVSGASPAKLVIDRDVGRLRISGAFRSGDTIGFANAAAAALSLRVERLPDGQLLIKAPD